MFLKEKTLLEFSTRFQTDENCKEYLASIKEKSGYKCFKCGHTAYQKRKDLSRECNICRHIESPTANTLFHKVKFGVRKVFNGLNFKVLHTMIRQVKSWIRTTFSWVGQFNINRYLNEFCYRINRSQSKDTIFDNLRNRMVKSETIHQNQIIRK